MTDEQKRTDERADEQPVAPAAAEAPAAPAEAPGVEAPEVVDPWAQAFDALEEPPAAGDAGAEGGSGVPSGGPESTPGADGAQAAEPTAAAGDAGVGAADTGGSALPAAGAGGTDEAGAVGDVGARVTELAAEAEKRAAADTARMFLDRADDQGRKLIRQTNGVLGATIRDPDIYQVVEGVATFINPDTGKPFTGDNPRAQAQEWCDLYNEELRDTFNTLAKQRQVEIETEMAPAINLLKFMPTYEKLDPVRQQLFDAIVEDYEVYNGEKEHVGYSCDLGAVLKQVNRQVASLQKGRESAGEPAGAAQAPAAAQETPPTGPALDMPTSGSGGTAGAKAPTNLSEALEQMQNAELDKLDKK